jgi:hypothetical protein
MNDHKSVEVHRIPMCDFPHDGEPVEAKYDGKTKFGPWANMCQEHFDENGLGLGLGVGQELILK